jgi:4-amino-4-deoxy-L-arabinose transferase-like glycosyltransferase
MSPSRELSRAERLLKTCAELERRLSKQVWVLAILATVVYFAGSIATDFGRPLWYDEIFTRYISHLDTPALIWQALTMSVDNQPYPFYVITHYSQRLFGDNAFAIRFPETLAFAVMCVCIYVFTRVRTNRLCAMGAALFPFSSGALYYATEGRPYGLELGFCGLMLVCWQAACGARHRKIALAGLAVSVAGAVSSHYLAVLLLIPIGLGELTRIAMRRRWDFAVWAAMAAGLTPLLVYLPLIRATRIYTANFWAPPSFVSFVDCFKWLQTPAIVPALVVAFALVTAKSTRSAINEKHADEKQHAARVPLWEGVAVAAFVFLPVYQVAISPVTGVLLARYVLGMVAGAGILFGFAFYRAGRSAPGVAFAFAITMGVTFGISELNNLRPYPPLREAVVRTLLDRSAGSGLPVVVTEAQDFLDAWNLEDEAGRQRLFYIVNDGKTGSTARPDSDDIELPRLQRIVPVPVFAPDEFVRLHPTFLVAEARQTWLIPYLLGRGATVTYDKNQYPLIHVEMGLP